MTGYFFILQGMTPPQARLFVGLLLPTPLLLAGVLLMMRRDDIDRDDVRLESATDRAEESGAEGGDGA